MAHICDRIDCVRNVRQCSGSKDENGDKIPCDEGPQSLLRFSHGSMKDGHHGSCWVCDNRPWRTFQKAGSGVSSLSFEQKLARHQNRCKRVVCWCSNVGEIESARRRMDLSEGLRRRYQDELRARVEDLASELEVSIELGAGRPGQKLSIRFVSSWKWSKDEGRTVGKFISGNSAKSVWSEGAIWISSVEGKIRSLQRRG